MPRSRRLGRYRLVHETMRGIARREPTFALHVHIGVRRRGERDSPCSTGCVHISRCSWRCRPAPPMWRGPGDRAGLEPDDALPGLPPDRACPWCFDGLLRYLGRAMCRPARALRARSPSRPSSGGTRGLSRASAPSRFASWTHSRAWRPPRAPSAALVQAVCRLGQSRRASRTPRSCTPGRRSPRTAFSPHATGWPPSSSTPSAASAYRSPICLPSSSPRRCPMPPPWAQPTSFGRVPALVSAPEAARQGRQAAHGGVGALVSDLARRFSPVQRPVGDIARPTVSGQARRDS